MAKTHRSDVLPGKVEPELRCSLRIYRRRLEDTPHAPSPTVTSLRLTAAIDLRYWGDPPKFEY